MSTKFQVFTTFVKFKAYVSTKIKTFQSDGGDEFMNTRFQTFLEPHGLLIESHALKLRNKMVSPSVSTVTLLK